MNKKKKWKERLKLDKKKVLYLILLLLAMAAMPLADRGLKQWTRSIIEERLEEDLKTEEASAGKEILYKSETEAEKR